MSIGHFEKEIKTASQYFPTVWIRYVDNIFAIVD